MMVFRPAAVITVLLAAIANRGLEARSPWAATGPPGASVTALAAWPSNAAVVFAGTAGNGLYLSIDGGTTWRASGEGLAGLAVSSFSAGFVGGPVVFAGTSSGLFETTDSGASWRELSNGITGSLVDGIAVGGSSIYASAATSFLDGSTGQGEVFASTDGGASFVSTGLQSLTGGARVRCLALDSHVPASLYAGVDGVGIFKRSGAGSWTASSTGLPPSSTIFSISVDPATPAHVFAGADSGLFASLDGGAHWSAAGAGLPASAVNAIARSGSSPQNLYAGVGPDVGGLFESTDGGAHWAVLPTGFGSVAVQSALVLNGNPVVVYAGSDGAGIGRSSDGGVTWASLLAGLPFGKVSCLASNSLQPETVLAGNGAGIFASFDGGATWTAASGGVFLPGGEAAPISVIGADPSIASRYYAGMSTCLPSGCSGAIFQTTDSGHSWSRLTGAPADGVASISVDPADSSTVYFGTRRCGNQLACSGSLWRSTDAGASWQDMDAAGSLIHSPVTSILIDRRSGLTIDLGTYGRGVLRSDDGGASWHPASAGLSSLLINDLIAGSAFPALFAATSKGVFRSGDGSTWSPAGSGLPASAVNALAFAPGSASDLFAGTQGSGLWTSADGGAHWKPAVSNGSGRQVSSIVFASSAVGLRAGTESGVYRFAPLSVGPVPELPPIVVGGR